MFRASWLEKYEGEVKTLQFYSPDGVKNNPLMHGLGYYKDIQGKTWDVIAIICGEICARPVDNSHWYYDTGYSFDGEDTSGEGSYRLEKWPPCKVEIMREPSEIGY